MGVKHFAWASDLEWAYDSPIQRYVFLEAAYLADKKGVVRASQMEMAERLLLSRQTISREFARLRELGLLKMLYHGRYGIYPDTSSPSPEPKALNKSGPKLCVSCHEEIAEGDWHIYYTKSGEERAYHVACDSQWKRVLAERAMEGDPDS